MPALLGPMVAAVVVDLTGLGRGAEVPGLVESAAFLAIGLQVGVSFTRAGLRTIGRALPLALAVILALVVAAAGLGAVLAAASDIGADVTFVLSVQVLRLFVMLLSAPLVARWLRRSAGS